MKNKGNIKILLPAVVLIWALLIYKFVSALNPDEIPETFFTQTTYEVPEIKERDTFSLLFTDYDPFLDKAHTKRQNSKSQTIKFQKSIEWPDIKYLGRIADNSGKSGVYIISVNGSQHLLKSGESGSEIKVLSGSESSVKLGYNGQTKTLNPE